MADFIPVLAVDQLPEGGSRAVQVGDLSILVCRGGGEFHAVANRCSHQCRPLEGGRVRGHFISCPVHGVRFDLRSGEPRGELTQVPIPVYPTRVVDGRVEVRLGAD